MADLDERQKLQELQNESQFSNNGYIGTEGYQEETAAEIAPPISGYQQGTGTREDSEMKAGSTGMGLMAIATFRIIPIRISSTPWDNRNGSRIYCS